MRANGPSPSNTNHSSGRDEATVFQTARRIPLRLAQWADRYSSSLLGWRNKASPVRNPTSTARSLGGYL